MVSQHHRWSTCMTIVVVINAYRQHTDHTTHNHTHHLEHRYAPIHLNSSLTQTWCSNPNSPSTCTHTFLPSMLLALSRRVTQAKENQWVKAKVLVALVGLMPQKCWWLAVPCRLCTLAHTLTHIVLHDYSRPDWVCGLNVLIVTFLCTSI